MFRSLTGPFVLFSPGNPVSGAPRPLLKAASLPRSNVGKRGDHPSV